MLGIGSLMALWHRRGGGGGPPMEELSEMAKGRRERKFLGQKGLENLKKDAVKYDE